jgi:alkylhydroperoxidase family enzyme
MRKFFARRLIRAFGARYEYDVSYLTHMLDVAPAAFFKFAAVLKLSRHVETAPAAALFAAKIVGALHEDCGPCVQLAVDMAREAGVADHDIDAVLAGNSSAMSETVRIAAGFARAVADKTPYADDARDRVRALWGDKGVVDLTLAVQIGRMFPMIKSGLGYARTCGRITVGERTITPAAP